MIKDKKNNEEKVKEREKYWIYMRKRKERTNKIATGKEN